MSVLKRYSGNPVITPGNVPPSLDGYVVRGAFNPGAADLGDEIILLLRVAEGCEQKPGKIRAPMCRFDADGARPAILEVDADDPDLKLKDTRGVWYRGRDYLSTLSHIRIARSADGHDFRVDPTPFIFPANESEVYGVEDARAVNIENRWYVNYTAVSPDSWATALAITEDFRTVRRLGLIFHPENKDVAIFPERVGGKFVALHRPNNSGFGRASIWLAESPDLLHWGKHRCILRPRDTRWECMKIGGGASPVKTPEGWLIIYHAKGENSLYSLWGALLDLEEPWKVVRRGREPLLYPEEAYEVEGFFGNVVFSNGIVERNGRLLVYYGAADQYTCVAEASVSDIIAAL